MNRKKAESASHIARRFIQLCQQYEQEMINNAPVTRTKISGALRRASMDLTRALADLRRPG